eukprot:TRINITY_DN3085_c0_g1_i17.p1 TRINITY_DN3085_c0_g1~~TRINITY_DN3085_c0_g1_i17.p1  ORF type:complete len:379 (+),score=44.09 TRINITY_DN3085_c0_g1_i17:1172-2308(+)
MRLLTQPEWRNQPIMNLLIQLSSGYPRIVEALSIAYEDLCQENPNSLSHAVGIVRRALGVRRLLMEPSIENIVPALLGKEIRITHMLPDGSGQSYVTLIQDGTFVGQWQKDPYFPFVPTLPLLPLYIWASGQTTTPTTTLFEFMKRCTDCTLAIHKKVDPRVFRGEGFELIHAWFSVLRLQLEAVERKNTPLVFLLSPVDKVSNMKQLMDPLLKTRNHLNDEKDVEEKLTYFLEICRTTPETTVVLHVGGNFPGTDILVFKSNANCVVSLSLQQCKYLGTTSEPFDTTDLNNCLDQVKKNWEAYGLTLTQSGTDRNEPTVSPLSFGPLKNSQINVEIFICGKVAASLPRYKEVKVYDEYKLKNLYGPTLFSLLRPTLE